MLTARLVGPWNQVGDILKTLPQRMQRAGMAALREEGEHVRAALVEGVTSGAPGGQAFAPHSPLTVLLGGGGQPMMRSRRLLAAFVVVEERGGIFVGVRGERLKVAQLHDAGATFRRPFSSQQRRWFFGALRRAGVEPKPGMGGGVIQIPPRPIVGPVAAKALGPAAHDRIRRSFVRHMGGVFGTA